MGTATPGLESDSVDPALGECHAEAVFPSLSSYRPGALRWLLYLCLLTGAMALASGATHAGETQDGSFIQTYCLDCHSGPEPKGDVSLQSHLTPADWEATPLLTSLIAEQTSSGAMPPEQAPQPTAGERIAFLDALQSALAKVARQSAGDPGDVVLRRLNNAEYTYTLRDLSGIASLEPAATFPTDSASGEGFLNQGQSLVMSPSLLIKYLEAAREFSQLLFLLPDGIDFSYSTSRRDRTEALLSSIRSFYRRFSVEGADSSLNLQGIRFSTRDGGVIPLGVYLRATLELRSRGALVSNPADPTDRAILDMADSEGLSPHYLSLLWNTLNSTNESPILGPLRRAWRDAHPNSEAGLASYVTLWQSSLWRFTTVGHIGKRDGPKAWQEPVSPIIHTQELRLDLEDRSNNGALDVYVEVGDAGDPTRDDLVILDNLRLTFPDQPDLPLSDLPRLLAMEQHAVAVVRSQSASCLRLAATLDYPLDHLELRSLAASNGLEPALFTAWCDLLGISRNTTAITDHLSIALKSIGGHDFVQGWNGGGDLSVIANASAQSVRIPGNLKPFSVAVHPSPTHAAIISWQSPVHGRVVITGEIEHAHPECGNGTMWSLQMQGGARRQTLARGTTHGSTPIPIHLDRRFTVHTGDVISLSINARDGNHACDLTSIQLTIRDDTHQWDLSSDVAPNILSGNPLPDAYNNSGVWHFHSKPSEPLPDSGLFSPDSLLSAWAEEDTDQIELAQQLDQLLHSTPAPSSDNSANARLSRVLLSPHGPLLGPLLRQDITNDGSIAPNHPSRPLSAEITHNATTRPSPINIEELFGRHPDGLTLPANSICLRAPALLRLTLPSRWTENGQLVAKVRLAGQATSSGSVQVRLMDAEEWSSLAPETQLAKGLQPGVPILANAKSPGELRISQACEDFRSLFPAALCYSKIVPVDEVVTLTLFYREDDHLRRLMLSQAERDELDRLWSHLHYVSQDALKQVDAFEQLWQYATQDADPSAFEPLRKPIYEKAEQYRRWLLETEPVHLQALSSFASRAYRRPLTTKEQADILSFYQSQRDEQIDHEDSLRLTLTRILVSPDFLYRIESPPDGHVSRRVSAWELATRLSYFLHASTPDAELLRAAEAGLLNTPDGILQQTRRLLKHPRIRRLSSEFATAWLHLYDFTSLDEKSPRHFPEFSGLQATMLEETERFFTAMFQQDRPILDIINADYSYLNEALARFYTIPEEVWNKAHETENGWRLVRGLEQYSRGGILTHASILSRQSGASRTSPILRGNWIAEVLLGDKLPPPPKNVPQLPADEAAETRTVRELTEMHSTDPSCYGCHRLIDPYGYTLEAFDAIGRHRQTDLAGRHIDDAAKVVDGTHVQGLDGLREYLLHSKGDIISRQFCKKLLGYALGRRVLLSDSPLLDEMIRNLKTSDYRVSTAIENIVLSPQFLEIRGRDQGESAVSLNSQ